MGPLPFLSLLGYELEYIRESPEIGGKKYPISHRAVNRGDMTVHVIGFTQSMDAREDRLMSAHSLAQEYLNLADDRLFALVTNGLQLRLLRDASRLVRLSYVEFDLQRMMEEELYPDFAVLSRLLHASRMPARGEDAAECILEGYHQDAMENGERIRGGLSAAVERSIVILADGFLSASENEEIRRTAFADDAAAHGIYHNLLVLVYRLLFLLVIEERDLVFTGKADPKKRETYYNYYSASRLRRLAEIARPEDGRNTDLWVLLLNTFRLFEEDGRGDPLGISALGGDLFDPDALGQLSSCTLANKDLVACLSSLDRFDDPETHQTIRVNYGALNVEEFGSVYEGLLEKDPVILRMDGNPRFSFKAGDGRSSTGSHYTSEELTHPLIRHSLDYVIADRLTQKDPEKALLSIHVCDPACGSGHILLNAARRIGLELARVRSGVEQPAPPDIRHAVRDSIRHCLYGVDKNPYAVELCKVALWLESHGPGEPLGFLDHHIKCGDSVVGIARRDELLGIPDEAFKRQQGDDATASVFAKRNRKERETRGQNVLDLDEPTRDTLDAIRRGLLTVDGMSEHSIEEIENKRLAYENLVSQNEWIRLRDLADMQNAQFFIPKTEENKSVLVTDGDYLQYVAGGNGYPDCFRIVEKKVKPERMKINDKFGRENWWRFLRHRPELATAIAPLDKVMVITRVSKTVAVAFSTNSVVFSDVTVIFILSEYSAFALMQFSFHYFWAWKFSSTLKGDLRYAPSDCFETFPFPACLREHSTADPSSLESVGRQYYEHRQALMLDMQLGLTKTYNLFHDPDIKPGTADLSKLDAQLKTSGAKIGAAEAITHIQTLRDLHMKMDAAVLAAYGWTDIVLGHDFHAVDFLPENDRVRFTISPQARRELLKRLLELNHRYHAEEEALEEKTPLKKAKKKRSGHGPELGL